MTKVSNFLIDNNVFQILLALMIWGVICYLFATGQAVPDALLSAGSIILGYYFHSAARNAVTAAIQAKAQTSTNKPR